MDTAAAERALDVAPPIEVEAVEKTFPGGVRALGGVSFRLAAGDRACLLGPNGAGKTTLIRLLIGALAPTSGQVRLFGRTASEDAFLEAKRRVGIVPQSPGMYRDLTAREYLDFVRKVYGRGDATRVVEAFGLGTFLERRMAQLSGGTQRRLCLAAALLGDPELLLLDEPTVGLDPLVTREVHAFLRDAMKGRTVLLCTHDLDEAEALTDVAVVLDQGKVLVHERIETLRARTRPGLLLRAAGGPRALMEALTALGQTPEAAQADSVRVHVGDPQRDAPLLLRALLSAGVNVFECRPEAPTLEDMFVALFPGGRARES